MERRSLRGIFVDQNSRSLEFGRRESMISGEENENKRKNGYGLRFAINCYDQLFQWGISTSRVAYMSRKSNIWCWHRGRPFLQGGQQRRTYTFVGMMGVIRHSIYSTRDGKINGRTNPLLSWPETNHFPSRQEETLSLSRSRYGSNRPFRHSGIPRKG